jgi:hypothetical protein
VASTIVTHQTASLTATTACTSAAPAPDGRDRASRAVASVIAVSDQSSAAEETPSCRACSQFHATRHCAEQNRECSRRGRNAVPHCSQARVMAIRQSYIVPALPGAQAVSEDSGGKLAAAIRKNLAASAKVCVIARPASQSW